MRTNFVLLPLPTDWTGLAQSVTRHLATTPDRLSQLQNSGSIRGIVRPRSNSQTDLIHWIESNGRRGGVLVPMSLVDRLANGGAVPRNAIVQRDNEDLRALALRTNRTAAAARSESAANRLPDQ